MQASTLQLSLQQVVLESKNSRKRNLLLCMDVQPSLQLVLESKNFGWKNPIHCYNVQLSNALQSVRQSWFESSTTFFPNSDATWMLGIPINSVGTWALWEEGCLLVHGWWSIPLAENTLCWVWLSSQWVCLDGRALIKRNNATFFCCILSHPHLQVSQVEHRAFRFRSLALAFATVSRSFPTLFVWIFRV